ncbi:chaperone modulator CbpM [Lichenifustis flavocetrariae]|uniref:Chaperone modulator CbpM n=1 Tax=Lichenifustis flavocetrariae TaxID=2949735 RepID=A0AA41Z3R5_9HYPH|nr:chaperone modulator CbpM [Lichenifustis flavocetrariae]MCW6512373.1 chaperone modulator CbpM [Lichenifustis flavocetrariae]
MITIDALIIEVAGLDRAEVEHWIDENWVQPDGSRGTWLFREIDVARLHLIRELRHDLGLKEDVLPIVLSLIDQLYGERRRLRRLRDIIDRLAPFDMRLTLLDALSLRTEHGNGDV